MISDLLNVVIDNIFTATKNQALEIYELYENIIILTRSLEKFL